MCGADDRAAHIPAWPAQAPDGQAAMLPAPTLHFARPIVEAQCAAAADAAQHVRHVFLNRVSLCVGSQQGGWGTRWGRCAAARVCGSAAVGSPGPACEQPHLRHPGSAALRCAAPRLHGPKHGGDCGFCGGSIPRPHSPAASPSPLPDVLAPLLHGQPSASLRLTKQQAVKHAVARGRSF